MNHCWNVERQRNICVILKNKETCHPERSEGTNKLLF